jgi:hypothetical protein
MIARLAGHRGMGRSGDVVVGLARPALIADQFQCRRELQSCCDQPVEHDVVQAPGNPVVLLGQVPGSFR